MKVGSPPTCELFKNRRHSSLTPQSQRRSRDVVPVHLFCSRFLSLLQTLPFSAIFAATDQGLPPPVPPSQVTLVNPTKSETNSGNFGNEIGVFNRIFCLFLRFQGNNGVALKKKRRGFGAVCYSVPLTPRNLQLVCTVSSA